MVKLSNVFFMTEKNIGSASVYLLKAKIKSQPLYRLLGIPLATVEGLQSQNST